MKKIYLASVAASVFLVIASTVTALADPIEGKWLRPSTGTLVEYAAAGSEFCGTVLTGEYKGQSIGCLTGANGAYQGEVIDLEDAKTYKGKATVKGSVMKLSGCVAIFCKGEDWQRQ